ncbi:MAG: DNA adenine methylase [Cyanobacteria bacterium HKST-UBA05]|nr:DNA adenine methylase [Cyanobacteria bacterium HKST-UBA05]
MSSIVYQSKKSLTHHRLFKGLPAYFGGKRKLLPWIFGHLAQHIPPSQWPSLRFLDLFMGGGSVSLFAKAQGFAAVLSNDLSPRCEIIANALLANHHQPLTRTDLLQFVQNTVEFDHPGSIETELSTSVFSTRHAQWLDRVRGWADVQDNPTKAALWRLMLWHLAHRFVCFPTSLGSSNRPFAEALDGMRSWDELNPKRYTDGSLNELLKPATKQIVTVRRNLNHSIFAGGPTTFSRLDALDCLQQTPADVVFMDPPY